MFRFLLLFILAIAPLLRLRAEEWAVLTREFESTLHPAVQHQRLQVRAPGDSLPTPVEILSFDDRAIRFKVIDNPTEPRLSLAQAMGAVGALAGVNGGYFHPDYRPVGLVIAEGETVARAEKAALLSGVVVVENGQVRILRYQEFNPTDRLESGIQAGPFLIDQGEPVAGLNADRRAKRTLIASDGAHRHALVVTGVLTLAQTAQLLKAIPLGLDWKPARALNLDGGSSTACWVGRPEGRAFSQPEWGHVRNFLAILPK